MYERCHNVESRLSLTGETLAKMVIVAAASSIPWNRLDNPVLSRDLEVVHGSHVCKNRIG